MLGELRADPGRERVSREFSQLGPEVRSRLVEGHVSREKLILDLMMRGT